MKIVMPLFFLNNPTYLTNHSSFMGKIWTSFFSKILKTHSPLAPSPLVNKVQGERGLLSLSILDKKKHFLASHFLIFLSSRFAMLHIFYKQLELGDSTGSYLWLWLCDVCEDCCRDEKCSRLNEMSNFNVLWNFQPI